MTKLTKLKMSLSDINTENLRFGLNLTLFGDFDKIIKNIKNYHKHTDLIIDFFELLEDTNDLKNFCATFSVYLRNLPQGIETEEKNKIFSVMDMINTLKPTQQVSSSLILTESLIPFIKSVSSVYGIPLSENNMVFEYKEKTYVLFKDSLRFDEEGKYYEELKKTPVSDGSHDPSPAFMEGIKKLMETPPFVAAEPTELELENINTDLELVNIATDSVKTQKIFRSIGGGVSRPPESPSPNPNSSYSEVTKKNTPVSPPSSTPLPSIPEHGPVTGKLYVTTNKTTGKGMAFINAIKMDGKEIYRTENGEKIKMGSIFCSRFVNLEKYHSHTIRVPYEFLTTNENNKNQFWPLTGFMNQIEVHHEGSWKKMI